MDTTNYCAECERLTRERDEARERVEVCLRVNENVGKELLAADAEVARLEGLILDWWDGSEQPQVDGFVATVLLLEAKARRIRANCGRARAICKQEASPLSRCDCCGWYDHDTRGRAIPPRNQGEPWGFLCNECLGDV